MHRTEIPSTVFSRPLRLNHASAWHRHIPFAFWLVAVTHPRTLVELGTHWGDSYFAFCQAAVEAGVPLKAHAVDTWAGDEHAGAYGEEVYESVSKWNSLNYAGFSTLLRTTFDEAAGSFEDASIDVVHIDGLHTYEAVKHDYETWLPKVSNRGVVVLHDTEERTRDFGVYRLWNDLKEDFPSFGFRHGHGLGILLVGSECPEPLAQLARLHAEPVTPPELELFEILGDRVALFAEVSRLKDVLASHRSEIDDQHEGSVLFEQVMERADLEQFALSQRTRVGQLEALTQSLEKKLEAAVMDLHTLEAMSRATELDRDDALSRVEELTAELAYERETGLSRWAGDHGWSDRVRLALPHRWGLLSRAMKDRW